VSLDCYILCIETSHDICSVAISYNGNPLICINKEGKNIHAASIHLLIDDIILATKKIKQTFNLSALMAIAISAGPGSYTGLRIGFSVAKAMSFALNIPLISVSTLQLLFENYKFENESSNHNNRIIYTLLPSRIDEFYYSKFVIGNEKSNKINDVITLENLIQQNIIENTVYISLSNAKLPEYLNCLKYELSAALLCKTAYNHYVSKQFASTEYIEPNYIKAFKNYVT
jgi:tRNA threonylcarbamoyladenosine biosynthesis protein TsaB